MNRRVLFLVFTCTVERVITIRCLGSRFGVDRIKVNILEVFMGICGQRHEILRFVSWSVSKSEHCSQNLCWRVSSCCCVKWGDHPNWCRYHQFVVTRWMFLLNRCYNGLLFQMARGSTFQRSHGGKCAKVSISGCYLPAWLYKSSDKWPR